MGDDEIDGACDGESKRRSTGTWLRDESEKLWRE